jgi:XTP/dITP diphosphohydrolase
MKKILVATENKGKLRDFKKILKGYEIISLKEIGNTAPEPEECGKSFVENSTIKAEYYGKMLNTSALADDSGLCVKAFNGEPGIYSKRYADSNGGFPLVFDALQKRFSDNKITDFSAYFVCNIAFYDNDKKKTYNFEGISYGKLVFPPRGDNGFGYCPIFVADGMTKTFGEISDEERTEVNHRFKALRKFVDFIERKDL